MLFAKYREMFVPNQRNSVTLSLRPKAVVFFSLALLLRLRPASTPGKYIRCLKSYFLILKISHLKAEIKCHFTAFYITSDVFEVAPLPTIKI